MALETPTERYHSVYIFVQLGFMSSVTLLGNAL